MRNLVCTCCGVAFRAENKCRYAPGHAPTRQERIRAVAGRTALQEVPINVFKELLMKIKTEQGLSWKDLAEKTGRSKGQISDYYYGKHYYIKKETADDILKRLSGVSMPPTPKQAREYGALKRKDQLVQRNNSLKQGRYADRKAKIALLRESLL